MIAENTRYAALLFVGALVVVYSCHSESGGLEPTDGHPDISILAGLWSATLTDGRFFPHLAPDSIDAVCGIEDLTLSLTQAPTTTDAGGLRTAAVSGRHEGGILICTGGSAATLPGPFVDDTTLALMPGPLDGVLRERCTDQGWGPLCGSYGFTVQLTLTDVVPARDGVRYSLGLYAENPSPESLAGIFELESESVVLVQGKWRGTR